MGISEKRAEEESTMKLGKMLSLIFAALLFAAWYLASRFELFRSDLFPTFGQFFSSLQMEIVSGRLLTDIEASLFRWLCGFLLATVLGIPLGLLLGRLTGLRYFCYPYLNLLRSLSPLAWIPFAVVWFGIGDPPVIFLIAFGCLLPLSFATMNAVFNVPRVYDQLARDYHFSGLEYFSELLFPAVLPQVVSALRLVASLGWIILVPAEMLAGKDGLGFAILDARNGMRVDLLVLNMIFIASVGLVIDSLLSRLNQAAKVRWSYEH
jgi:NitT/TauT family transport system permease protein